MTSFGNVPEHVIIQVFSFLTLEDRKNTRLVCKQWHRLSYTLSLIRHDVARVENYDDLEKTFISVSRFVNIILDFNYSRIYTRKPKFWSKHGQWVKSLEIQSTTYAQGDFDRYGELSHIFGNCPDLESLSLLDRNEEVRTKTYEKFCHSFKLPKLLKVRLTVTPRLAVLLFQNFAKNSPKLENIQVNCYFHGNVSNEREAYSDALYELVQEQACVIKELEIMFWDLNVSCIDQIFKVVGPQFMSFSLNKGKQIDGVLSTLAKRVTHFQQFFLWNCNFTEMALKAALINLKQLTVISMSDTNINDSGLAALRQLPNLSHLNLCGCRELSEEGMNRVFGGTIWPQLIELRLTDLHQITDTLITDTAKNFPNLKTLVLSHCQSLTYISLEAICTHNLNLTCFTMQSCDWIDNPNVGMSINALKELRHLDLFDNASIDSLKNIKLPHVQVIDYDQHLLEHSSEMKELFPDCPSLKEVNLHYRWFLKAYSNEFVNPLTSILECHNSPFGPCYHFPQM